MDPVVRPGRPCTSSLAANPPTPPFQKHQSDGDGRLLERLIDNLLANAVSHNHPGGHVDVTTGVSDGMAFLTVANTGPLVLPEEAPRLLQPFQRLGPESTRRDDDDLGLSIVNAIATTHDARLTVHSRDTGGLSIRITFPMPTPDRPHGPQHERAGTSIPVHAKV